MRAVVQRVTRARVVVDGEIVGEIENGLVVLLGVAHDDAKGKMNVSLKESDGGLLIVSQFTLYGDVRRGLRPSWSEAAPPEVAEPLYDYFVESSRKLIQPV